MKSRISILIVAAVLGSAYATAQNYYDDIYYDASKDKKTKERIKTESTNRDSYKAIDNTQYSAPDNSGIVSERDVDEYNRRGDYNSEYSVSNDTIVVNNNSGYNSSDDFEYTNRIRRFYNPTIVVNANDPALYDLLIPLVATSAIVDAFTPYSWYYGSPWYNNWAWGWDSPWYWNSWNRPYWGGYYSSWYGCGYHHGYYPSWGWGGCYPNWGPPSHGYPGGGHYGYNTSGSRRPIGYGNGGNSNTNRRPGYATGGDSGRRPGYATGATTRPSTINNSGGRRPTTGGRTPGAYENGNKNNNSTVAPNNSGGRRPSGNTNRENNSYRENNYNSGRNYNSPSFNSGSSSGGRGSYSGGSHGGGGGGRQSGGGGGRR